MSKDKKEKKYKFESGPLTKDAWKQFRSSLAAALSDLDEDEFLVISTKS